MHIAAQTSGIPSSNIVQSYSQSIKRRHTCSTAGNLKKRSGPANRSRLNTEPSMTSRKNNRESFDTTTYNGGKTIVIESDAESISEPMIPEENQENESHDGHGKQDWSKVQTHAWTLLLTIAIKSFIEGIAFVLTLQDSYAAGMAFLVAMLFKLFPLEPGYAIILSDAGLNHF